MIVGNKFDVRVTLAVRKCIAARANRERIVRKRIETFKRVHTYYIYIGTQSSVAYDCNANRYTSNIRILR